MEWLPVSIARQVARVDSAVVNPAVNTSRKELVHQLKQTESQLYGMENHNTCAERQVSKLKAKMDVMHTCAER